MVSKKINRVKSVKAFIFLCFVSGIFLTCSVKSNENYSDTEEKQIGNAGIPEMDFDTLFYDFGNLNEGEKVAFTFKFKNTGTADLLILDAFSTCGCTIPNYSKSPVSPGSEGKIEILFDSANRSGVQNKTITLKVNTPAGEKSLWIKANIKSNNKS